MTGNQQTEMALFETQRTMVLASAADGSPWTAPVYFLYQDRLFYFFSDPGSRHICDALSSRRAAAAIFSEDGSWQTIAGLQMDGQVHRAPLGAASSLAFRNYVKKFPTMSNLFADTLTTLSAFTKNSSNRLFVFEPDKVFYLNNAEGFGKRKEINL